MLIILAVLNFFTFFFIRRNLQVLSAEDLDFIKTKTKGIALSSFRN